MRTLEDKMNEEKMRGYKEGKADKQKETALVMLKKGLDIQLISEVTGLSEDEITKLNQE